MNLIDQPVTTHLIATQRRPTLKFIASQLKSLPVVTPSWPAALVAMGPLDAIPDPGEHEVPLGLNTQTGGVRMETNPLPSPQKGLRSPFTARPTHTHPTGPRFPLRRRKTNGTTPPPYPAARSSPAPPRRRSPYALRLARTL